MPLWKISRIVSFFASGRYRQPGATRSLNMLSGHPPEIIRWYSRNLPWHSLSLAQNSCNSDVVTFR